MKLINGEDSTIELWKDVFGWEGLYQVSNLSRVKAVARILTRKDGAKRFYHEKIKAQIVNASGYRAVHFSRNRKGETIQTHILIAKAFIPNPENKATVNHIDGNKLNNHLTNLEWATRKENTNHAWNMGLCDNTRRAAMRKVIDTKTNEVYESINLAAKEINISPKVLSGMITGYRKNKTTLQYATN